jgi:hypothetical protein
MSVVQSNHRISPPTLPTIVAAVGVGVGIAIAASAFVLTSNRADHTQPITRAQSPYLPAIHNHGSRQAHIVLDRRTGQAHGTVTPPITATHARPASSYLPSTQNPGTGQAHIVLDPRTGQAHGTVTPPTNPTSAMPNRPGQQ